MFTNRVDNPIGSQSCDQDDTKSDNSNHEGEYPRAGQEGGREAPYAKRRNSGGHILARV